MTKILPKYIREAIGSKITKTGNYRFLDSGEWIDIAEDIYFSPEKHFFFVTCQNGYRCGINKILGYLLWDYTVHKKDKDSSKKRMLHKKTDAIWTTNFLGGTLTKLDVSVEKDGIVTKLERIFV